MKQFFTFRILVFFFLSFAFCQVVFGQNPVESIDSNTQVKIPKKLFSDTMPYSFRCLAYSPLLTILPFGLTIESAKITSSISAIKDEELNHGGITDPIQLLQGKVAGLDISKSGSDPNGNFTARIRGLNTLVGNTEPLYVVDDVPNVSLQSVDVNDIESMMVLKDGSAAALYGVRANSGVILITTKRGERTQKLKIEYNTQITKCKLQTRKQNWEIYFRKIYSRQGFNFLLPDLSRFFFVSFYFVIWLSYLRQVCFIDTYLHIFGIILFRY